MITGFNTDIEHEGVIYHVQTEDKGVQAALILSLVYNRGTILASKRTLYQDLLQNEFDEKILAERLQKQHKLICAAVRAGRLDELKKMTANNAALKKEAKAANGNGQSVNGVSALAKEPLAPKSEVRNAQPQFAQKSANLPPPIKQDSNPPRLEVKETIIAPAIQKPKETFVPAIPQPKEELIWDLPLEIIEEDSLIVGSGDIIETETILSAEAVEIISDTGNSLPTRKAQLEIEFLNETSFRAGERKTLNIRVFRGSSSNFIREAQVMVKVLGSSFRPLIFHARTNDKGIATVHLQLPQFRSGRGAILVRAINEGEEAELRQIVRQS